jgi:hypothetical protein
MKKIFAIVFLILAIIIGVPTTLVWDHYTKNVDNFSLTLLVDHIQNGRFQAIAYRGLLNKYNDLPLSTALLLHEHLPGLFPLTNLCWKTDAENNLIAEDFVLPGRKYDQESLYRCSNGERVKISSESGAYLTFGKDLSNPSHVYLVGGKIELGFDKQSIFISTRSTTFIISARSDANIVTAVRNNEGDELFQCIRGDIDVAVLETVPATAKSVQLGNQACQMKLANRSLGTSKDLPAGSRILAQDLSKFLDGQNAEVLQPTELIKSDVAAAPTTAATTAPGNKANGLTDKITIQMSPKKPKGDVLLFSYQLPLNQPMVCNLKTGSTVNGPFTNAYQFQAPAKSGTLDLQLGFSAFYLTLQCTDGKKTYSSNVLTPKK